MDVLKVIQMIVAPVVMISACGLLCLALYNRLSVLVSRIRAFHHERLSLIERLERAGDGDAPIGLRGRLGAVDRQVDEILRRARLVRNALVGLVLCVVCMLGCSLLLGASLLAPDLTKAALGVFILGVVSMLSAMLLALVELSRALKPVALERDLMLAMPVPEGREEI